MKKPKIIFVLATVFVLIFVGTLVLFNHQKPRLLVLHSYSEDGRWENAFNNGVQMAIDNSAKPLALRWHYMTFTDNDIPTPDEWAASGQRAQSVIDRWAPDVLLAVGEEAQEYVGRHYVDRAGIRLIYAVGEDPDSFGYKTADNVSGVREILPLRPIIELLSYTHDRSLRLRAIGINDPTGLAEKEQLLNFDWQQHKLLGVTLANDFIEWQQAVAAAKDADILLVLSSAGLPEDSNNNIMVASKVVTQWTITHAEQLAFGIRESFVAEGGAIAVEPAPDGIGQQATELALRSLPIKTTKLPATELSRDFTVALRPKLLDEFGLDNIPAIYYQASRAANALYLQ